MAGTQHFDKILKILAKYYPKAKSALHYSSPLEALISALLAPQCTDAKVNQVTPALFKKYKRATDYAKTPLRSLENDVSSINFYRNKAKSIQNCCRELVKKYGGKVPRELAAMVELPGIGRKTANMILANAYGRPGIIVDTHVLRVAFRLGLTKNTKPDLVEADLAKIVPRRRWISFSYQLVDHGRAICKAKGPLCSQCTLETECPKRGL